MTSCRTAALLLLFALVACDPVGTQGTAPASSGPALRVVTLAPHLAELMYDLQAGESLVGVSAYTDYPQQALALPVVSDAFVVDREQLAILEPDLLLAWESGTPIHVIEQLRQAGFRVEAIRTRGLMDVAEALLRIGALTDSREQAARVAGQYRQRMGEIARAHADSEPITVFYQISQRPLYTVNRNHYISDLVELCGGTNIFAEIGDLAPLVDVEAVIDLDPEVMLAGRDATDDALESWDRWPDMTVNRYGNRFFISADEIGRATTRLVDAAAAVCEALDKARANRREYLGREHGA